jgi:hypothetical protein
LRKSNPHAGDELGSTVGGNIATAPNAEGHGVANAGCLVWAYAEGAATYCGHHAGDHLGQSVADSRVYHGSAAYYVGAPGHVVAAKVKVHGKGKHAKKTRTKVLKDAGAVELLTIDSGRVEAIKRVQTITQATAGVPGAATSGNHFGYAVSSFIGSTEILAVGIPGESVPGASHAGAVAIREGSDTSSPWKLIARNVRGVAGAAHASDGFGHAVSLSSRGYPGVVGDYLLFVGVPGEDLPGHVNAGRVQAFVSHGVKPSLKSSQLISESTGPATSARYGTAVQ